MQTAIGNLVRSAVDLPTPDGLLSWVRTYNSADDVVGPLGQGWTAAHLVRLEVQPDGVVLFHDVDGRVLPFVLGESGAFRRPQDLDADLTRTDDGFTFRYFCGETWLFESAGRVLSWAYEGRTVNFEYDGDRLVALAYSAGRRVEVDYEQNGLISRLRSNDGRAVSYGYTDRTLTSVTAADGTETHYTYTDARLLATVADADGVTAMTADYDDAGRVSHQDVAGAGSVDVEYDELRTRVRATPDDAVTVFEHNTDARVVAVTDAMGNTTTFAYNDDGRFVSGTLPSGARIEREYDANGDLVSNSWAGATETSTYDRTHRRLSTTNAAGATTGYEYDGDSHMPAAVVDPSGARTTFTVRDGLVVAETDEEGNVSRYSYDDNRLLTAEIDPEGQRTRFGYDAAGQRTSVTTPRQETTTFSYDDAGRLTEVTDPTGGVTTYRYTTAGRLLETTAPGDSTSSNSYDEFGRLTSSTDPMGHSTAYEYDDAGNVSLIRSPDGVETTLEYDALGRLTATNQPDAGTSHYEYDADGNRTVEQTPKGTTRTEWDGRGNPVTVTNPDGAVFQYSYDGIDRVTTATQPDGTAWQTTYDDENLAVTQVDPLGNATARRMTPTGHPSTVIDPLGRRTSYRYDGAGRLIEITDPEGGRTRYHYDGNGRRLSVTTPAGLVTRYEFENGRMIASVDPRGSITRYSYDARGNRERVTTPTGATTSYVHSEDNRLMEVHDPRGGVTFYEHDEVGNMASITDAKGAVTRFEHDRAGHRTTITDPLGRVTRREYDDAGRLVRLIDPDGHTIHFGHDAAGRITRMAGDDDTEVTYTYDAAGRRASMTDATGTTQYAHDDAGRLTTVTYPDGGELVATYDKAGQRIAWQYPNGTTVHYRYDLNGRLVGLRDSKAGEAVYAVDPDGRLRTEQLPGGWQRHYAYDGGLLAEFEERRTGVPASHTRLERDPDGRVITQHDRHVRRGYTYDPAGELVGVTTYRGDQHTEQVDLAYDIVGNRTALVHDGRETRYLYDIADQLVAVESAGRRIRYRYDSAGRLVQEYDGDLRHRIEYNGLGHPRESTRTRAWAVERLCPVFDGDGLLAELNLYAGDEDAPKTEVCYRWSTGDAVPQILSQHVDTDVPQADDLAPLARGLASARFTYGYGRTFATAKHGSVNFARDAFGSAVRTEATEPWVQASDYDTFGRPDGIQPDRAPLLAPQLPRFGYRGELAYGSTLYLRARCYDTALGRFTTPDPVTVLGQSTLANHPYAYVRNDPLNRVDPLGTWSFATSAIEAVLRVLAQLTTLCSECQNPGNGIQSHQKCFQNTVCLYTRGFIGQNALDADPGALKDLATRDPRQIERAGQALAIWQLNLNRRGFWDWFWGDVPVNFNVDWEVGTRGPVFGGFRIDIMTDERHMYEVKRWKGPETIREVQNQLNGYQQTLLYQYFIDSDFGTELQHWAMKFDIGGGFWNWLGFSHEWIYVWGLGNRPGHIYVAPEDEVPECDEQAALLRRPEEQSGQVV